MMYPGITTDYPRLYSDLQNSVAYDLAQEDEQYLGQFVFDSPNVFWIKFGVFAISFVVLIILTTAGVVLNTKLFRKLNNETHKEKGKVLQRVMKTYTIVQTFAWPSFMWVAFLIWVDRKVYSLFHPCLLLCVQWITRFSFLLLRFYIGCNSFVVAIWRYLCIVHDGKISHFGVQKARKIILASSVVVP